VTAGTDGRVLLEGTRLAGDVRDDGARPSSSLTAAHFCAGVTAAYPGWPGRNVAVATSVSRTRNERGMGDS
jgi:hypothetical protein